ncbi:MAG: RsmB/NOP family class I SAM-dependent RNA methyltransferase [Candidatus Aenigmarchaeota archaeon]|nr:RsmB/NOP family class I SAM-dependent RNA methyltransferase [Candidatus Aenigmarchaeota archaeon]
MGAKLHSMPEIPGKMKERFEAIFGRDYDKFEECCRNDYKKSFRVNTLKISVEDALELLKGNGIITKRIPWTKNGFFTDVKSVGNSFENFMGYIYIQGPASMLPAMVLDPNPGETVLDMCASPGSKTTQIAAMMKNKGVLVANESDYKRIKLLRFNNDKNGVLNSVITNLDGRDFAKSKLRFDKILLDAPCTGEGIVMREWEVIKRWNMKLVIKMCRLQKDLIASAISCLKPGGTLVYSTCTLSPEENEEVIDHALKIGGIELEDIELKGIKTRKGLTSWDRYTYNERVSKCVRVWPQDNGTEGFFVAKLKKV